MDNNVNSTVYLADYQAPTFAIDHCHLEFKLNADATIVSTIYHLKALSDNTDLTLAGESLKLLSISIDGNTLHSDQYEVDADKLTVLNLPVQCELFIQTQIKPSENTSLNGLYQSGDMLCTQCEAQGFRRITYSLDRPDVLTTYTVKMIANKQRYPILLSNGNQIDQGEIGDDHFVTWHDPFPKPTYLFALVAGNLIYHSDTFTTRSGKKVDLHVLTRPQDSGKTQHAMDSLKCSMTWDEQVYDREYDLNIFHIVAVSDFNMGAMENKSLNIFNTKYVLANQAIATDQDYHGIESVIGHEYFHNWSGNRVTCRDWFQLSLKEGFTVLRDQQFSGDMHSAGVQRIDDVNLLRAVQFKEDAGPMAHPVRPESYEEINNFYTVTIYEKGAEVVRMLQTLLGKTQFKKACNHYFKLHDGQAVTTDDFINAMEATSKLDLTQFRLWYSQSGTPTVSLTTDYDPDKQSLTLNFKQTTPATPGQENKQPLLIPIKTALFDDNGQRMMFEYSGEEHDEVIISLDSGTQTVVFNQVRSTPTPSLLRNFSAPVKFHYTQNTQALTFLAKHEDDAFNRWEAMQQLSLIEIDQQLNNANAVISASYLTLYGDLLADTQTDPALLARLLTLPTESIISQRMDIIEPKLVHQCRERLIKQISTAHSTQFHHRYRSANANNAGRWTKNETGNRALRDTCLAFLFRLKNDTAYTLATQQYEHTLCMTDTIAALYLLSHSQHPQRQHYLDDFHQQWQAEDLLINKWFSLQSQDTSEHALDKIKLLCKHDDFDEKNPNKIYALIGGLLHGNPVIFHASDGSGYQFAADWILKLDGYNPQVASRMVGCFNQFKRYNTALQALMIKQMKHIAAHKGLSDNVSEIIHKALNQI